jgi:hypothetical protein
VEFDQAKVDEVVLALLHLNAFNDHGAVRSWKGFDWDTMNRLHDRGLISDPKSKAKSVVLTPEGATLAQKYFDAHFGVSRSGLNA